MPTTEPHVANHATHFLRRTQRLVDDAPSMALAMRLYMDPELLRAVLEHAPERAERIAISLRDDEVGPFVVVTRNGRAVTVLGFGMRPNDRTAVVTRDRLDAAASRVARTRDRLALVKQLEAEADAGELTHALRSIDLARPYLAREDFEELARWEPILGASFLSACAAAHDAVVQMYPRVAAIRPHKRSRAEEELLAAFWEAFWSASNLHVLVNVGDAQRRIDRLEGMIEDGEILRPLTTFSPMTFTPLVQHAARAIWATARQPRELLPALRSLRCESHPSMRMARDCGLAAVAIADRACRAEALRVMRAAPATDYGAALEAHWRAAIVDPLSAGVASPEDAVDAFTRAATELAATSTGTAASEMPADVARAIVASSAGDWAHDPGALTAVVEMVPWLVGADASELFAPREWADRFHRPYTPERALDLVSTLRTVRGGGRPTTVRKTTAIGRNDACSCGSGQKYKRCCLRKAA